MHGKAGHQTKDTTKYPFFYGYIVAAAGFMIWMIGFGISGTFGIFYKPILTEFGWSRADTVFAFSLGIFMRSFFAVFSGFLTDRLGPRIVVMLFGSFVGISCLLMSRVNSLWQFYLFYGVIGSIGMSVTATPVMATVARWFVKRRGLVTGIVQAGLGIGGLILAPLTGWLITNYGWRSTYVVLGIIALAGFILSGFFMRRSPEDMGQFPDGAKERDKTFSPTPRVAASDAGLPLRKIVITSQFWIIAGLYSIFGFCRSTFLAHTAAHIQDLGFSLMEASNVMAFLMASSMAGRIGMGRVGDAIGNRSAFMMSYGATTISLVLVLASRHLLGIYLFAFAFGFGWGAQAVLRFSTTAEVFGLSSLGFMMGILGIFEALASALGAYYAGFVYDLVGSYGPVFWFGTVVSLIGILLAALLKPHVIQI
ncbi:MAG: MFS transporter [Deltaproteobacteria bacterium]|nr:MFS transporter [Deltaproteobacteria bacterium]